MNFPEDIKDIRLVLNGNKGAFASLVNRHKTMVFSMVLRLVKNREDAEEVAQDTFVKAFRSLPAFRQDAQFSTWLYRIAYTTALSKLRVKKIYFSDIVESTNGEEVNYREVAVETSPLCSEERRKFLEEALARLPADEAMLISLYYYNGLSVEEISEVCSLSGSNIKVKLHRARKKLHIELTRLLKNEVTTLL